MARGDVRAVEMELPDLDDPTRGVIMEKYALQLQHSGSPAFDNAERVAVVLVSTDDEPDEPADNWECKIPVQPGLSRPSIIDGRWVFTMDRRMFEAGRQVTVLDEFVMDNVAQAVFVGLDLQDQV